MTHLPDPRPRTTGAHDRRPSAPPALVALLLAVACARAPVPADAPASAAAAARVERLLSATPLVDGHSDLLRHWVECDGCPRSLDAYDIGGRTSGDADIPRMRAGRLGVQLLNVFGPEYTARSTVEGFDLVRRQLALVGAMHRRGVRVLAGTDASDEPWVYPGASLHDELALLVEAGLSPLDALRAATIEPARYLGAADSLGLVAPGHAADLVLLDANPLDDVRSTTRIRAVVLRGRLLDRAALDRILDDVRRRAAGGP